MAGRAVNIFDVVAVHICKRFRFSLVGFVSLILLSVFVTYRHSLYLPVVNSYVVKEVFQNKTATVSAFSVVCSNAYNPLA